MSIPYQLTPQAQRLMKSLHFVLEHIMLFSRIGPREERVKAIGVLALVTHNWPDWIAGNSFFTISHFISDIDDCINRDDISFKGWKESIIPHFIELSAFLKRHEKSVLAT